MNTAEDLHTTVEEYVNNNRVQLHKFPECFLYFVYNKVTCRIRAYRNLDDLVKDFLFEVSKEGMYALEEDICYLIKEIYSEHQ